VAKKNLSNIFDELIATVKEQTAVKTSYIPDIITFCEDPNYLNLPNNPGNPVNLYPLQRIVLKCFYRGTKGNEKLELTEEERDLLKEKEMQYVIDKFENNILFRELILAWGRRCIGENTKIFDPETGDQNRVGDLWDQGKTNLTVCSLNENNYELEKTNADLFYNGDEIVYRISLLDGRYIDATDNHPFLTIDGWKELSELSVEEKIATPKKTYKKLMSMFAKKQKSNNKKTPKDTIFWMPIKSITKLGKQRTFDISVKEENKLNYVANNIISHNSGNDLLCSFIAAYEAMRLLEIPGGNPFSYYKIKAGNPIYILTVAGSEPQAKILFNEIKTVILSSPYFQDKIGDHGKAIDSSSIRLLTPADKEENIK